MSVTMISPPLRRPISPVRSVLIHTHPIYSADPRTIVQAPFVDDIINGPIRDVFLKHDAHLALCLYLQHRHHTVCADKAVVKVEGTAHLMDCQAVEDIVSLGNQVVPTTWMTSNGNVLPMEFTVVPAGYVIFLQHFLVMFSHLTPIDSPHQNHHTHPYGCLHLRLPLRSCPKWVQPSVWNRHHGQGCVD